MKFFNIDYLPISDLLIDGKKITVPEFLPKVKKGTVLPRLLNSSEDLQKSWDTYGADITYLRYSGETLNRAWSDCSRYQAYCEFVYAGEKGFKKWEEICNLYRSIHKIEYYAYFDFRKRYFTFGADVNLKPKKSWKDIDYDILQVLEEIEEQLK